MSRPRSPSPDGELAGACAPRTAPAACTPPFPDAPDPPALASGGEALEWIADDTADPAGLALDVQAVYQAVHELSAKLREAITAVDVLGLPYGDAARALGIRQGTLQSRLARAREQVAQALEPGEAAA